MTSPREPDRLLAEVRRRARRARHPERERTLGENLALAGVLGWMVVGPTLLGIVAGRWIDGLAGGGITFTAGLVFLGACAGSWLAWKRIGSA